MSILMDIEAILPRETRISQHRNPIIIYVVFIIFDNHVYYQIPISKLMEHARGGPFV
jgi:hypothetical protein